MARGDKDLGGNWIIRTHPAVFAGLAGVGRAVRCRAAHTRLTLPEVIPAGLLDVWLQAAPTRCRC